MPVYCCRCCYSLIVYKQIVMCNINQVALVLKPTDRLGAAFAAEREREREKERERECWNMRHDNSITHTHNMDIRAYEDTILSQARTISSLSITSHAEVLIQE